jgi:hypothetical protein
MVTCRIRRLLVVVAVGHAIICLWINTSSVLICLAASDGTSQKCGKTLDPFFIGNCQSSLLT